MDNEPANVACVAVTSLTCLCQRVHCEQKAAEGEMVARLTERNHQAQITHLEQQMTKQQQMGLEAQVSTMQGQIDELQATNGKHKENAAFLLKRLADLQTSSNSTTSASMHPTTSANTSPTRCCRPSC